MYDTNDSGAQRVPAPPAHVTSIADGSIASSRAPRHALDGVSGLTSPEVAYVPPWLADDDVGRRIEPERLAQRGVAATQGCLDLGQGRSAGFLHLGPLANGNGHYGVGIHGMGHAADSLYEVGVALAERGTDVLLMNRPAMGHGPATSAWPGAGPDAIRFEDQGWAALTFVQTLLAAGLPLEKLVLFGHSFGGFTVQQLLADLGDDAARIPLVALLQTIHPSTVKGVNLRLVGRLARHPRVLARLMSQDPDLFADAHTRRVLLLERGAGKLAEEQDARVASQLSREPRSTYNTASVKFLADQFRDRRLARRYVVTRARDDLFFPPAEVDRLRAKLGAQGAQVDALDLPCAHDGIVLPAIARTIAERLVGGLAA